MKQAVIRVFLPAFILVLLACESPRTEVQITLTEDVINNMRGGFGASIHAMQDSILVRGDRSFGGSAWGATTAASAGQWIAIASSNFCDPQFLGRWCDVAWHKYLTDKIKASAIRPELHTEKVKKALG